MSWLGGVAGHDKVGADRHVGRRGEVPAVMHMVWSFERRATKTRRCGRKEEGNMGRWIRTYEPTALVSILVLVGGDVDVRTVLPWVAGLDSESGIWIWLGGLEKTMAGWSPAGSTLAHLLRPTSQLNCILSRCCAGLLCLCIIFARASTDARLPRNPSPSSSSGEKDGTPYAALVRSYYSRTPPRSASAGTSARWV